MQHGTVNKWISPQQAGWHSCLPHACRKGTLLPMAIGPDSSRQRGCFAWGRQQVPHLDPGSLSAGVLPGHCCVPRDPIWYPWISDAMTQRSSWYHGWHMGREHIKITVLVGASSIPFFQARYNPSLCSVGRKLGETLAVNTRLPNSFVVQRMRGSGKAGREGQRGHRSHLGGCCDAITTGFAGCSMVALVQSSSTCSCSWPHFGTGGTFLCPVPSRKAVPAERDMGTLPRAGPATTGGRGNAPACYTYPSIKNLLSA